MVYCVKQAKSQEVVKYRSDYYYLTTRNKDYFWAVNLNTLCREKLNLDLPVNFVAVNLRSFYREHTWFKEKKI